MSEQLELCGRCGHALDHPGKRCRHEMTRMVPSPLAPGQAVAQLVPCPCPEGVRTDVLLCRQQSQLIEMLGDLLRLTCYIHEVEIGPDGKFQSRSRIATMH